MKKKRLRKAKKPLFLEQMTPVVIRMPQLTWRRVKSQMVVLIGHEGVITSSAIQEVANSVVVQY